ncbi:hypothetical protein EDC48_10235 [Gibbsiella quercinecans]|nr:hypothetical protein EDC48_10235 [Gibbsiella quercinecans]
MMLSRKVKTSSRSYASLITSDEDVLLQQSFTISMFSVWDLLPTREYGRRDLFSGSG